MPPSRRFSLSRRQLAARVRLGVALPDLAQDRLTEQRLEPFTASVHLEYALHQELRGHLFEHHAARAEMNCLDETSSSLSASTAGH